MYQNNPAKDFLIQMPLKTGKNCKPVSRILLHPSVWRDCYHLSGIAITDYLYLPTLPASRWKQDWTSHSKGGIYVAFQPARFTRILQSLVTTVSSYLTFSPLPTIALAKVGSYFLWHCLFSILMERPAVSGMRRSLLSGLSYPICSIESIARLAVMQR